MTNNELEILLSLRDEVSKKLDVIEKRTGTATKSMSMNWLKATAAIAGVTYAVKKLSEATLDISKELIRVNSQMEDFRTRIGVVAGSVEETNKIFSDMKDIASKVPQTFEQVMGAATNLTAVVKGGSEEVKKLMPIILDISAATGIGVEETTGQMIRMYSAGAASADMFRERGVLAALGFQAGVSYSNEETINTIIQQWEDGTSKYKGATDRMAATWTGVTSMMEDAWREFKELIGAELFEAVKLDMRVIVEIMNEMKKEGGEYQNVIDNLSNGFVSLYEGAKNFGISVIISGGQAIDIYNELNAAILTLYGAMVKLAEWSTAASLTFDKLIPFNQNAVDRSTENLELLKEEFERVWVEIGEARNQADIDYSMNFTRSLDSMLEKFNQVKEQMIAKDKQVADLAIAEAEKEQAKKFGLWEKYNKERAAVQKKITEDMAKEIEAMNNSIENAFSNTFAEMIKGNMSAKEAFSQLGEKMIDILIDFVAEQIVQMTISRALAAITSAFVKTEAAAIAAAWAPAAALASLATLGGNSTPATAALASTTAFSIGLSQIANATAGMTSSSAPMSIPAMAEGGIVNRPTLALIGEAGPEAVVPLGGRNRMGDIFVEVNINNPSVRSMDDIYSLSDEVSEPIAKEIERI